MLPLCTGWGWLLLAVGAQAQGTVRRYYFRSANAGLSSYQDLTRKVEAAAADTDDRTGLVAGVYAIELPWCGVAAVMQFEQVQQLLNDPLVAVQLDVPLGPVSGPAGAAWPLNQWQVVDDPAPCVPTPPVVYLLDTGVAVDHNDFDYPPGEEVLSFLPGMSFGFDRTTLLPVLIPPNTDPHDHGTRVAGCLGGRASGLLGPLGGRAKVMSILIYDLVPAQPPVTFASQAIEGILAAVGDHQARKAQPYLRNHASVLVFAHSTTAAVGRVPDLDQTLELAWQEGMHVVLAAGNEGAAAVEVSPAGAAWGYVDGGGPTRFFFGAKPPAATWFRAEDEFQVIGGYREVGVGVLALSTQTNVNIAGAETIDIFAAGEAIPVPSAVGPAVFSTGTGTSLAAGFAGAMTSWSAFARPWARPSQVRSAVRSAATMTFGFPKAETPALPGSLSYREWIDHFYPETQFGLTTRDPSADPDVDGVVNFVEYHCGQDPRVVDSWLQPELSLIPSASGSIVQVSMPVACHLGSPGAVTWELQTTTDLVTWDVLATSPPVPVEPPVVEGDGRRWAAAAVGISAPPGSAWYRIRFSAPAPLL